MLPFRTILSGLGMLVALWAMCAGPAWAHHPERQEELSRASIWPDSLLLELRYVDFDVANVRGNYWMVNLRGSARVTDRLTISGNLPLVHLTTGGRSFLGLGDISNSFRYDFLTWDKGKTALGIMLTVGWPTGNPATGIGAGHFELAPGLAFTKDWEGVTLFGQVAVDFSLGSDAVDGHDAGNDSHRGFSIAHETGDEDQNQSPVSLPLLVEPHADRELIGVLGATIRMTEFLLVNLSVGSATVLESGQRGQTFINVSPTLLFRLHNALYGNLTSQFPLTSQRRFNWQTGFVFAYSF